MECEREECEDKDSVHYFMCHMTQEEFNKYRQISSVSMGYESGLIRNERYEFNKIKSEYLQSK